MNCIVRFLTIASIFILIFFVSGLSATPLEPQSSSSSPCSASKPDASASQADKTTLAALDTQYQAAVKINDAATMDRILADDFILVTGSGKTYDKAALLEESRSGRMHYDHQEDTEQTVRIWGDTAVVTAKLWEAGTDSGNPFDKTVWFSDTYVRTPTGWRYVFGQSSLAPPKPTH